jgi:hypothetical protein
VRTEDQNLKERTKQFAARYPFIRKPAKIERGPGAWQAASPLGDIRWGEHREAYRARSRSEFIAKCGDSLRELEESAYWLELLVEGEIMASEQTAIAANECDD